MKPKRFDYLIFVVLCLSSYLLPSEIVFFIALLGIVASYTGKIHFLEIGKILLFPLILILLGLINSYHNDVYLVIRDFYYFGSSIIVFYFGYSSGLRFSLKKLMKVIVQLGFLLALIYLVKFLMEKDIESFYQIRQQLGTASYLIIISLILLILSEKYSIEIFPKRIRNGLLVYFTAISILALSRTFLLVFIVLLICGLGLLSFNKYFIRNILVIICTVLIGWWSLSRIDGMEPYSFIGKLQSSLDEVTIQDYNPKQEIIYSWRGVEAYKGMQEFKAGSLIEKVVGHGFGKSADIGFEMTLDGKVFTSISKFHNGYISILLKTGILGVIVYFLFFFQMVWNSLKQDNKANLHSRFINNMIVGISIVYLLTTIVIAGWLNTGSFIIFSFLLGYFLKLKKKQNNTFELSDIKISS